MSKGIEDRETKRKVLQEIIRNMSARDADALKPEDAPREPVGSDTPDPDKKGIFDFITGKRPEIDKVKKEQDKDVNAPKRGLQDSDKQVAQPPSAEKRGAADDIADKAEDVMRRGGLGDQNKVPKPDIDEELKELLKKKLSSGF